MRVIAIKENYELCPWADIVYGCDRPWWEHRKGLPEFKGLKVCWGGNKLTGYPDIRRVKIALGEKGSGKKFSDRLSLEPGTVGGGSNSGFQALNLAVQSGSKLILLVGFDLTTRYGAHWYGRNRWMGANNPDEVTVKGWRDAFECSLPLLVGLGVKVYNASDVSELKAFQKITVAGFLDEVSRCYDHERARVG